MKHDIDVLGCGVIYIDKERVFGSKPYGLFSTINWKATDEDLKRIADRCLEVIADRKEDMLTHEYCDTCNHIGCEHCIADGNNPYCVPSNYKSKDASKASIGESFTCIITEDRDTQILDGWQVKPKTSTTPKDESKTEMKTQNSNKNSNVISVYDGVSEAVRCAMCSNPNKSDRGCDGACSYDKKLYKRIMKAIAESIVKDEPQTERSK